MFYCDNCNAEFYPEEINLEHTCPLCDRPVIEAENEMEDGNYEWQFSIKTKGQIEKQG